MVEHYQEGHHSRHACCSMEVGQLEPGTRPLKEQEMLQPNLRKHSLSSGHLIETSRMSVGSCSRALSSRRPRIHSSPLTRGSYTPSDYGLSDSDMYSAKRSRGSRPESELEEDCTEDLLFAMDEQSTDTTVAWADPSLLELGGMIDWPYARSASLATRIDTAIPCLPPSSHCGVSSSRRRSLSPNTDHASRSLRSRARKPSTSSTISSALVGTYEESLLSGRMSARRSQAFAFQAEIGALGGVGDRKCPRHVTVPFEAHFYDVGAPTGSKGLETLESVREAQLPLDGMEGTPYVGTIDLESHLDTLFSSSAHDPLARDRSRQYPGYRIPHKGQLQVIIKNGNKTAIKVFLLPYDFSDMEVASKTFLRQKTYVDETTAGGTSGAASERTSKRSLRYAIHAPFVCLPHRRQSLTNDQDTRHGFSHRHTIVDPLMLKAQNRLRESHKRIFLAKQIRVVFTASAPDTASTIDLGTSRVETDQARLSAQISLRTVTEDPGLPRYVPWLPEMRHTRQRARADGYEMIPAHTSSMHSISCPPAASRWMLGVDRRVSSTSRADTQTSEEMTFYGSLDSVDDTTAYTLVEPYGRTSPSLVEHT